MPEWLTLANANIVWSWIEKWVKSKNKSKDFSELRKYLSLRELYLLRCMREYGRPTLPRNFGPALAKWDDMKSNAGWEKAAEYACKNLAALGLAQPSGSDVELTDLAKALIDEERGQARSVDVFKKELPSY